MVIAQSLLSCGGSENAEEMASGEEARFWADLYQKYTI